MAKAYKLIADSAADKFHNSRAKIRMYAGGFANGKTTALVAETLKIIRCLLYTSDAADDM
jgi:hypothetical protein